MGRVLLQALVGIMPLTQAQASGIVALTQSQLVSGESWALSRDMHTERRAAGGRDCELQLLGDMTTTTTTAPLS